MTSTASTILRLELIGTGDQAGQWGSTTNTNLGTLLEGSIAGMASVSVTSDKQALVATDYAADQARMAILTLTTTTSANFAVYAPPVTKTYTVYNNTSYTATIYNGTAANNTTAAGTGVALAAGERASIYSDGTNFYKVTPVTVTLSAGSAAAPSLSFTGDSDTGIYSSGANAVSVATGGAKTAEFTTTALNLYATDSAYAPQVSLNNIKSDTAGPYYIMRKARNDGSGGPAVVQSGDAAGVISYEVWDGAAYRQIAQIGATVDGTPRFRDAPGALRFYTTLDGGTTLYERLTITNAGYVGVGNSSPATYGKLTSYAADGTNGLAILADSGLIRAKGYQASVSGAIIEATNTTQAAYIPLTVGGSTVALAVGGVNKLSIDASGNATFANNLTVSGTLSAAPPALDAVGSIVVAYYAVANTTVTPYFTNTASIGDTVSGSNLRYNVSISSPSASNDFNAVASASNTTSWTAGGSTLSGTWRCIGRPAGRKSEDGEGGYNYEYATGLWVRVS